MAELIIAGIEPVKRKKGWFELSVKSRPPFLIDEETLYKSRVKAGEIISDSRWKQLKNEADLAWLKYRGMQILSRRMLSERDLRRKLAAERRPRSVVDEAMSNLRRFGFYDDSLYAAAFVRSQMARGVKSKLYLRKKLWEKGINEAVAARVLEKELSEFDERSAVAELAAKKYRALRDLPPDKARLRLINFLRGRGFSWDVIRGAVDSAMGSGESEY